MFNEITKKLNTFQKHKLKIMCRFLSQDGSYSQRKRYYEALNLTPKATQAQIKSAFYRLSMLYHPDKNNSEAATVKFREINEAYEVLGNYELRKKYDRGLLTTRRASVVDPADEIKDEHADFYKSREKSRKPVPRGRSQIYNFDEFYRMHYGEAVHRDHGHQKEYVEHMKSKREKTKSYLLLYLILAFCFISLYVDYQTHRMRKPKRENLNEKQT
ncbi:dnaJ homolog subfamily C member 30-like [Centruroides sculpturatus]|uniref:dnaJ homolog subfamily C member 30-like n=1 Tax=Centruroides sculpturatus TaxID=218467 RepID=UPI000C6E223B|nr:dnaJ homolog subfamily C member 30-like [Centruroides sculpturatus]XP_023240657.1 dnaJ homolog subfamily C member 30-like [Centruroides sculpturatus]XP_023240658.1 dnaJ homolog subfamily C member 30-like [Centruroides sculpturatus]XP_023240659.1 dnaJ homolog subfamily C member 30-like [Centruroides sculpturatus]